MLIDFNELVSKKIENFKDGKKHLLLKKFEDDSYKIMQSVLPFGGSIGEHTHVDDCEIIYVISGRGEAIFNGKREIIKAGDCHYCPKGSTHYIENNFEQDLVMFAVVPKK